MVLFFDLDGPILDVSEKYYQAYACSLKEIGGTVLKKNEYWRLKRLKVSDYEILSKSSKEHVLADFLARRNYLIESKEMLALDSIWQDLRDTYEALFRKIPTVLVTLRTNARMTNWQLKNLGIDSYFLSILSNPETGISDERWKIKVNAITGANIIDNMSRDECVFVGDTETDIMTGKDMGIKTIGVSFGIRDRELLRASKPDLLFDTPIELSRYLEKQYL